MNYYYQIVRNQYNFDIDNQYLLTNTLSNIRTYITYDCVTNKKKTYVNIPLFLIPNIIVPNWIYLTSYEQKDL